MGSNGVYDVPNVAMIPPIPDVHWTTPMTFHLCEAPIVLTSEKYAQYYKWHVDRGHYVILDNGAAVGGTVTNQQLIDAAGMVDADEVVIPDVMADKDATLAKAKQFLKQWIGPTNTKLMFVPQGEAFIDWAQCLAGFMKMELANPNLRRIVVGIGKHMHARVSGGRRYLVDFCQSQHYTCHLLGASDEPLEDIKLLDHPAVRGSDTSLPFAMAQSDYALQKDPVAAGMWSLPVLEGRRPSLDFLQSSGMLGRINMETYLYWVQSGHSSASNT
jgi:hypothetical protein